MDTRITPQVEDRHIHGLRSQARHLRRPLYSRLRITMGTLLLHPDPTLILSGRLNSILQNSVKALAMTNIMPTRITQPNKPLLRSRKEWVHLHRLRHEITATTMDLPCNRVRQNLPDLRKRRRLPNLQERHLRTIQQCHTGMLLANILLPLLQGMLRMVGHMAPIRLLDTERPIILLPRLMHAVPWPRNTRLIP